MLRITALPYDFEFEPSATALLLIDMQRDFILPGGFGETLGNGVSLLQDVVPTVRKLLDGCRGAGLTIIHTNECHRPDLSDCPPSKLKRGRPSLHIGDSGPMGRILIQGEIGADFVQELTPIEKEFIINKPGKGAFYATQLQELLQQRGITHLLLCGVTTEVCVQTTMREANDRGYECLLIEDATGSYFPEFKEATLQMMRSQGGIVGWTATTDQLLQAFIHVH